MRSALVLVSFGTSDLEALSSCIEPVEGALSADFDGPAFRAFTSRGVRAKLSAMGLEVDGVEEALGRCRGLGFEEVFVQPLHLIAGEEFSRKVVSPCREMAGLFRRIGVGLPLLCGPKALEEVALAVAGEARGDLPLILAVHGARRPYNLAYLALEERLKGLGLSARAAAVEGEPTFEEALGWLEALRPRRVELFPFFLASGVHVKEDLLGEEGSWRERLEGLGFGVEVDPRGLGGRAPFVEIYRRRLSLLLRGEAGLSLGGHGP